MSINEQRAYLRQEMLAQMARRQQAKDMNEYWRAHFVIRGLDQQLAALRQQEAA